MTCPESRRRSSAFWTWRRFSASSMTSEFGELTTASVALSLRRNVKATDAVVSSPNSLVIDEAENRLHVQKALLRRLLSGHAT